MKKLPHAPVAAVKPIAFEAAPKAPPVPPAHEPIAIIGMAHRLPGGDTFWQLLTEGRDGITSAEVTRLSGPAGLTVNAAREPTVAARSEDGVAVLHAAAMR